MSKRTSFLALGGALGCLVLIICVAVAVLTSFAYASSTLVLTNSSVDRIAYVDNDMNIQLTDAKGEQKISLTKDASVGARRVYMYPTWSPNSQFISFVGVGGPRDQLQGILQVARVTGGDVTTLYQSDSHFPFYLYWSPDNQKIGFLAESRDEMTLLMGRLDGREEPRPVETGAPMYWAWSPDGNTVLMHVGGSRVDSPDARLAIVEEGQQPQQISDRPAAFQAPQFSPDGKSILYASAKDSNHDALYVDSAKGGSPKEIETYSGAIAFAWSPDGNKIASLVTSDDAELPFMGPIQVSDANGQGRQQVTKEDAIAFYWSPNGKQIAYLTLLLPGQQSSCAEGCLRSAMQRLSPAYKAARTPGSSAPLRQAPELRLRWQVVNLADNQVRPLATFTPTDHFLSVLPYFDQYARSMTFWSPDSQKFVYTQREGEEDGSIWVVDMSQNSKPTKIADGTLAVWSWK